MPLLQSFLPLVPSYPGLTSRAGGCRAFGALQASIHGDGGKVQRKFEIFRVSSAMFGEGVVDGGWRWRHGGKASGAGEWAGNFFVEKFRARGGPCGSGERVDCAKPRAYAREIFQRRNSLPIAPPLNFA